LRRRRAQLEPQVRLAKLDTEAHPQVAAPYNIRSIPTMVLFQGGREVARISGALGAADIERWVRWVSFRMIKMGICPRFPTSLSCRST
jgi:thioredoxin-like negative regulator of GroEL